MTPEELTEKILDRLDLADEIMGNAPPPRQVIPPRNSAPHVLVSTSPKRPEVDLSQGLIINGPAAQAQIVAEIAPPVAVVRNPEGTGYQETEAELEQKKQALHALILQQLPQAMTVKLPALDGDITLIRFVQVSPANMNFVRVLYAQSAEQSDGPTIQLATTDVFDPAAIKAEILKQAEMRYRKSRTKIEPRLAPHPGMPNPDDLALIGNPNEPINPEDVADWERLTGTRIARS